MTEDETEHSEQPQTDLTSAPAPARARHAGLARGWMAVLGLCLFLGGVGACGGDPEGADDGAGGAAPGETVSSELTAVPGDLGGAAPVGPTNTVSEDRKAKKGKKPDKSEGGASDSEKK